jgi:hypothetical protein
MSSDLENGRFQALVDIVEPIQHFKCCQGIFYYFFVETMWSVELVIAQTEFY